MTKKRGKKIQKTANKSAIRTKRSLSERKKFSLVGEYKKSLDYVRESKKFIYTIIGIFLLFGIIGFFIPAPEPIYIKIIDFIKEILEKTKGMSHSELISFIISNNLKSTFFGIIIGAFFGLVPIISALANGYLLGFVSTISVSNGGILSLWRILPHGIFELPAVFISLGLGLRLGMFLWEPIRFYWGKKKIISFLFILIYLPTLLITLVIDKEFRKKIKLKFESFRNNLINSLKVFLLIVIPLLIIAGIIEGTFMVLNP